MKLEVPAIKNSDMRQILVAYNLADKLDKGELICPETGDKITWDNLGALKVVDNELVLYSIFADSIYNLSTGS